MNDSNNIDNSNNSNSIADDSIPARCMNEIITFYQFDIFIQCAFYYLNKALPRTLFFVLVIFVTIVANLVCIVLLTKKIKVKSVFDKIIIAHAFVDLVTNTIALPSYLFFSTFGYWPFGEFMCYYWVVLDNGTCTCTILHFIFMSYARLRCIFAPRTYDNEILIKYTYITVAFLWLFSGGFWIAVSVTMIRNNYIDGNCFLPYDPPVIAILIMILGVILPLLFCIGVTIYMSVNISKTKKFKKKGEKAVANAKVEEKKKLSELLLLKIVNIKKLVFENAQVKLSIITTIFVSLYLPFPTSWVINSIYPCVPDAWLDAFYLMSYCNSLVNPVVLLILNFKFFQKQGGGGGSLH